MKSILLLIFGMTVWSLAVAAGDNADMLAALEQTEKEVEKIEKAVENYRAEILSALLADKIEEIIETEASEAARVKTIAGWIFKNTNNLSKALKSRGDALGAFAARQGDAAGRGALFVEMTDRIGVYTRRVPGDQAVLIEAVYADAPEQAKSWHLFDFTNGCAFVKDNRILSLDDLKKNPELIPNTLSFFSTAPISPAAQNLSERTEKVTSLYRKLALKTITAATAEVQAQVQSIDSEKRKSSLKENEIMKETMKNNGLMAALSTCNNAAGKSRNNLMVVDAGAVNNAADWTERRANILANVQAVTGPLPGREKSVPLDVNVLETVKLPKFTRQKITYVAESGDRVPAYLFIPTQRVGRLPAMICLHQTYSNGKDEPAGISGNPNLYYALELAERGYVTLAPDCPPFGENKSDAYRLGYESVTMKAVWNHVRGIDLLAAQPEVDPAAIGSIGHSHGGFNTLMLALFDERIKVAVVSCGFSSFRDYKGGDLAGWSQRIYYMPKIKTEYNNSPDQVPFDFPEILGALAPRPVFINAALGDELFTASSVDYCVTLAMPVYKLLGASENLIAVHPPGKHDFPVEARLAAYKFIDKALRKEESKP
jgi:hypothetical protein